MSNARGLTYGIAIGAGLMFFFDPRGGNSRRALLAQKARRAAHDLESGAGIGARDFEHRIAGLAARVVGQRRPIDVPDNVLVARVRAKLGRVCSHPHAVHVTSNGSGFIELSGPILRRDLGRVLPALERVPGVRAIADELDVRDDHAELPALQRHARRRRSPLRLGTPATRFSLGAGAIGVCVVALVKGHPFVFLFAGLAASALARSIAHRGEPTIHVHEAPIPPERHVPQAYPDPYPEESGWVPAL